MKHCILPDGENMYTSLSQIDSVLEYFADLSGVVPPTIESADDAVEDSKLPDASDMPVVQPHQYCFINWAYVSSLVLSREQYEKYAPYLVWDIVSKCVPFDVALTYRDKVNWALYIESHPDVDVAQLVAADVAIPWPSVCLHAKLSEDEIRQYLPQMESECSDIWHYLSRFQRLGETLIAQNAHKFDWVDGPYFQNLSAPFLLQYTDLVDVAEFHDYGLLPL